MTENHVHERTTILTVNGVKNNYDRWRNSQPLIVDDEDPREEEDVTELNE